MRKRIWAVLLSVCLLVGLLPTTALAADTGQVTLSLNYDESLCSIRVIDGNTQSEESPTVFVSGNGQSASVPSGSWAIFQITNIRDGYRIGSVTLNGTDRTRSFVNGAYGGLGISNISRDYALTAVMEEIPETLPSVTSVTLYTDEAGTQPAAENIAYTSESTEAQLFGKATFSDGVEYPVYYARGQWQFTTDGTTWQDTESWGSNRFDFSPGWPYHEELDFLTDSYDIRLKVNPQDLYTTGSSVYSNVIHINGGAGAAPTDPENPATDVVLYVDGVDMANGGTVDGAVYTAATNTLTLTNASIAGYYADADAGTRTGIYYKGADPLNIDLSGKNTVSISCISDQIGYGIDSSGPVTITGSGTLAFQAQTDGESTKGYGATAILATDLTVTGGAAVTADLPTVGTYDNLGSIVSLSGDLTVSNDASLTATGKYEAVKTSGDVNIATGGSLTVKAITAVIADGSVTVENGGFTADAVGTSANMGYAVKFAGNMTISGDSTVLVNQSADAAYAYGLYNTAACDLTISGGTVKIANGSNGTHQAIRLQNSASTFTMTGGDVTVSGGTGLYYGLYNAGTTDISGGVLRHTGDLYIGGLTTLTGEAKVTVSGAAYLNGLTMQDSAALDVTNSIGTAVTSYEAVQVTGGILTASSETSDALNLTSGDLTVDGGTVNLTGSRYGLYLSNTKGSNLVYQSGVLSASGSNGAVVWFSWDTDFSENPPVSIAAGTPITPAGAKLLTATMDGAYAAAYVTADKETLTYEGTTVTNAVKSITFGTASDVVLYVNGVDMANGGEVTGAVYDADTNTLTLNEASITQYYTIPLTGSATDPRAGIYYQGEKALNVVVSGGSTTSVVPGVTGTSTAIPAFGIYADGPVNVQLDSYLNILPGTADGAESDNKSDQGAKVLGGAVYVTGNMTVAGSSFLRYLNFGTFRYQSGTSGLQTANNYQMPFQVDGNLTVSNGPTIMGGEMKVGGNASVAGKLDITAVVGNYQKVSNGILTVYAADATLDVSGTLDLTGGSVTIGSGCTRGNYAGLKAGTLRQSGGTLTLNNDEKNDSIQCDDLVQTGGTLTANCAVEAGSNAHLSGGSLTAAALTGADITVGGTANVTISGVMGGLGANITISGGTVNITSQTKGILTANLTVTGGTTTVTAQVALSFSDILKRNGGNFSITGGTLKLEGSTIAIRWDDVSNRATDSTHFEPNVTVPVTPSGAKFLETVETLSGVALYAATYVAEGVDAITVSGGYASNGLTAITFGAEPCENHNWGEWAVAKEATCTEKGVETRTCSVCGETETRDITALGHDYKAAVTAPTCTAQGYTTHTCSRCGDSYVDTYVNALGHTWGQWTVTTPATCTEAGVEKRTCSVCGETETQDVTALGHTQETLPGKAATCTETGLTDGVKCAVCGEILTAQETIPVTAHTEETIPAVPATCTETGLKEGKKCSVCGKILTAQETAKALGHDWGEWVVDKEATGTEDGSRHRDCSRCDAVDTEVISMLEKQNVYWIIKDTITWTYGGSTNVTNTAYNDTADGGALTYSSSDENVATVDADGKATIVGAGTATITVTAAKVDGKYAATSASYTLIINKAPLIVTANNHTITYGQAPAGNGWTADGLKYNDTQSVVTGTAAYTYSYEQYGNAGSYAINVSGLTAKNYDITFAPGTLTVSKATDYTITLGNLTQRDDDITDVTASITPQDVTAQIKVEYQVDGNWTTSLPTAAGEYQVRASLTGSSNIQTDGAYTTGTLTIQRSIGVDGTDVTVTVDEGKANITVTEGELADIVDNADGDVSINLGGVEGVDELVLPGSLLEALSESDKADSLTITTENASISMSGAVLDTVASAITGEDTVAVKLTAVEERDLTDLQQAALNSITQDAVIVEVSLVITHADGTETELHQLGGNVEVTVPYAGEVPAGKYIVVCYLSDDGNVTYVRATYNAETQQVTFTTNHFSNYAVFVSGDPAVVVNGGSGSGLYAEGETVTVKADSKSGYTFAGWEVVSGGVTLADTKAAETTFTMPATNVELKATYTKITSGGGGGGAVSAYTLTFDTNGGSKIDSVSKVGGATIDLTGYVPTRAGYDFDGWYSDAKLTDKITSVKLTKNMTVYAKWTEKGGENPFIDVADDAYYADAVIWAVGEGITSGTTATTFSPNTPCTRAQAVTFPWRAAGSPEPAGMSSFTDVPADSYYAKAVAWAVEQGITKGTSDTTFSPNATCTRAQIVTFLWRSQNSPASDSVNPFTDVAADAYYANAVLWAVANGITNGTSDTTFSPSSTCTRAQIVTFLFRCLGGE
ncbi:MAG: S-layer homology domain-containing protein [Dysosmobacter sp.]|nr:S-layer homology domain-containing protein [Dysosmobacter sp.]